jgi:predicted TIM-barrel fold metal-dependent hydrolase
VTRFAPSPEVAAIRADLDHPVIDSDGHAIEYLPVVREYVREAGGPAAVAGLDRFVHGPRALWGLTDRQMRAAGSVRTSWWGLPTANTLDRATAILPRLLAERLPEIGIDVAVLYPTFGLVVMGTDDDDLRRALARGLNTYYAEHFGPHADRLLHVGIIPMHTPEEAIDELDHAVGSLGLKAFMFGGLVSRPVPGVEPPTRAARWLDTIGLDSAHDYDPLWARCVELGVSPTFHSTGMGWGSRVSTTSYVANHLGNFAAAGEALARSLFLGGVPTRFPSLRFAFLEGGVGWATTLLSDMVGHWEKRNREAVGLYDPARLDRGLLRELFAEFGDERFLAAIDDLAADGARSGLSFLSMEDEPADRLDEFARSGVGGVADIVEVFARRYFYGCEADDPVTALAFARRLHPGGTALPAVFASDIGHWDVPDDRQVLPEAWELVEDGHLTRHDFRAFCFDHPVRLWASTNPGFFRGTAVEGAVEGAVGAAAGTSAGAAVPT